MSNHDTMRQHHTRKHPLRLVATALVLAVVALAGLAPAASAQQDSAAVAINTKDDSSLFRLAFSIKQVTGEVVDQSNAAVAYASCERCQTVAIAIQVLLVMTESPDTITPENIAIAINQQCSSCVTVAMAYQWVLGADDPVGLTADGRRELARIRQELRELGQQDLSAEEIIAGTEVLVDRLRKVLETELVVRDKGAGDGGGEATGAPEAGPTEGDEPPPGATPQGEDPPPATSEETTPAPAPSPDPAPEDGTSTMPAQ